MKRATLSGLSILIFAAGLAAAIEFLPPKPLEVLDDAKAYVVEDFTGDGRLDLVYLVNADDTELYLAVDDGAGSYGPGDPIVTLDRGGLMAFDVDHDGDMDAVTTGQLPGEPWDAPEWVEYLVNDGKGSFTSVRYQLPETRDNPRLIDMDGDGDLDLVDRGWWNADEPKLEIHLNDGAGDFSATAEIASLHWIEDFDAADLDGDGRFEIVAGQPKGGLVIFRPAAGGGYEAEDLLDGLSTNSVTFFDIDQDGHLDLIASNSDLRNGPSIRLFRGDGTGALVKTREIDGGYGLPAGAPSVIKPLDVDGDGDLDLVTDAPYNGFNLHENVGSWEWSERRTITFSYHFYASKMMRATMIDPDGDGTFSLLVEGRSSKPRTFDTGHWDPPVISGFSPDEAGSGEIVDVEVTGTNFAPDTRITFHRSGSIKILETTYHSPERLTARIETPIVNKHDPDYPFEGDGFNAVTYDSAGGHTILNGALLVRSYWDAGFRPQQGLLVDKEKAGKDRFQMKKADVRGAGNIHTIMDHAGEDIVLLLGPEDSPLRIEIAGDAAGWKYATDGTRMRYRSPKGVTPKVRLDVRNGDNNRKRYVDLKLKGFDLTYEPDREVRLVMEIGGKQIALIQNWDDIGPGKWKRY